MQSRKCLAALCLLGVLPGLAIAKPIACRPAQGSGFCCRAWREAMNLTTFDFR